MATSKNQLLDPLGTLCRLILLNFEPKSTKVSIANHTIQIQAPFSGQWIYRRFTGDGVSNIFVLFQVFHRVIEWYVIPLYNKKNKITKKHKEHKEDDKQMFLEVDDKDVDVFWEHLSRLCDYVCSALSKLQYTYETDNQLAVIALQYYINMLRDSLVGRYDYKKLPSCILENKSDNFLDYDKIKSLWDCKKVQEICHVFDILFKTETDVENKESVKSKKIESYLSAIDKLLSISDDSFRELIQSSNRGN
jgi:hypothetical protein